MCTRHFRLYYTHLNTSFTKRSHGVFFFSCVRHFVGVEIVSNHGVMLRRVLVPHTKPADIMNVHTFFCINMPTLPFYSRTESRSSHVISFTLYHSLHSLSPNWPAFRVFRSAASHTHNTTEISNIVCKCWRRLYHFNQHTHKTTCQDELFV